MSNQRSWKAMVFLAVAMSFVALFASGCSFEGDGYEDVDGFTIAKDWKLSKIEELYYKFFDDNNEKPWLTVSFDEDISALYFERSATSRKLASSDVASLTSWADYESANGDSLSVDGYGWVNFVFFPDKTQTTDFTTARVGSFENTANSSLAPYLERASARISTSSITMAQGEILDIVPATTGAGLYAIPKPVAVGSTVIEPTTDTDWNGAPWVAVSGNKISLTLDFSGQSLLVLYCRERDPGKGWSKTVRLDIIKSETTTTTTTTIPQGTGHSFPITFSPLGTNRIWQTKIGATSDTPILVGQYAPQTSPMQIGDVFDFGAMNETGHWLPELNAFNSVKIGNLTINSNTYHYYIDRNGKKQVRLTLISATELAEVH